MKIGYACLVEGLKDSSFRSCKLKNASEERLKNLIDHNLRVLDRILDYNRKNNIRLFRITSDLIPFGSKDIYSFSWESYFEKELLGLKKKIEAYGIRVSVHPGQYTVLNSKDPRVIENSIRDLDYHLRLLEVLTGDSSHKIILHIGGVYGDKPASKKRFIENYGRLSEGVRSRLVIENDDRSYNIGDLLDIGESLGCPVVFDNLHHAINPPDQEKSDREWIKACARTWREGDGLQKIHYSQQAVGGRPGAHSASIDLEDFLAYYNCIKDLDLDLVLEVKDKNISAVKCVNSTIGPRDIKYLELDWARYKYSVLDKSHRSYLEIRELLKDKKTYPYRDFYRLVDEALAKEVEPAAYENGLVHVWGYLKDQVEEKEKKRFMKALDKMRNNDLEARKVKDILGSLAEKYQVDFLLNSYYFYK